MIRAVFQFEMMQAGRRQRGFFLRWIYAAFLLVQIAPIFFLSRVGWARLLTSFNLYGFFEGFLTQHFVILALLTPAMVGGAITEEKTRGTLQYLLTANIRPGELILGKILAHIYQLIILSLVGLPLMCFFAALGQDSAFPVAVLLSSLALLFGIAAVSILVSVWCRKTTDAILCIYLLMGAAVFLVPFLAATRWGPWLATLNPLRVLSLDDISLRWKRLGEFLLPWLSLGCAGVLLASWRLRRAYRRQLQILPRNKRRWWQGQHGRVRGNPVLWRERQVEGIAPLELLRRLPRWLGVLAVMVASAATLGYLLLWLLPPAVPPVLRLLPPAVPPAGTAWDLVQAGAWSRLYDAILPVAGNAFFWQGLAALLVVTFIVAIRASGSITGEKEKGTWQALLLTPLTTKRIITGKHWGIFWACVPYIAAHAAVAVPLSFFLGFEALTWAVLYIGVMLLAVILSAAVGLWASARAASSWRSLLTTMALFYLGWLLFFVPVTFILFIFKGVTEVLLRIIGIFADTSGVITALGSVNVLSWALCFGLATAFWVLTHRLLASAAERVGRNDRTMDLDFYFLYNEYCRRKQEEKWEAPRIDGLYEMETTPLGNGKAAEAQAPIPFQ